MVRTMCCIVLRCVFYDRMHSYMVGCRIFVIDNVIISHHRYYIFYILYFRMTDLEWKVLYVGSAHDSQYDQILDEILVGPIPVGLNKFVLQADAPNITQLLQQPNITSDDILGVTVVLVTCSYKEREFIRIGYYVNNEYNTGDSIDMDGGGGGDEDGVETTTPKAASVPSVTDGSTTTTTPEHPNHRMDDTTTASSSSLPTPPPVSISRPKISIHDIQFDQVQRQILADKPRVTKFPIPWNHTTHSTTTTMEGTTLADASHTVELPSSKMMMSSSSSMVPPLSSTPSTIGTAEDEMMMMETE